MDNKFYVYVYLDPRKPGNFVYGDYIFTHEPFYLGKGCGARIKGHIYEANSPDKEKCNKHKLRKIRKILKLGLEPIKIKLSEQLFEKEAFVLEMLMIKTIGRSDKKLGPLTNQSDGGEGDSGRVSWNKGTIGIMKPNQTSFTKGTIPWNKGKKCPPNSKEQREKISKTLTDIKRKPFSEEHKQKLREARIKYFTVIENRIRVSNTLKEVNKKKKDL